MERLRPRERRVFSGFTSAEIEKMERLHKESGEQSQDDEFFKRLARSFNRSKGRVGKPAVKWTEVQSWFQDRQQSNSLEDASLLNPSEKLTVVPEACLNKAYESAQASKEGEKVMDLSELEFEAKSSKDGAWYDVDTFLNHRFLSSGEAEVCLRFVGFGAEEDEWEKREQAIYYDAHIIEIQKRVHDIRGCRCLFSIRYDHDKTEERVRLRRLCRRPAY